ncbi:hypothetical protein KACC15558_31220 [Brevibacterium ammoniilyticum]|uniref:Uncharacterized protein n=1 Tax=Brevibacterium ammoniilyticum TaxID=1046555 RepID=A0ABP9UAZ3_9MICO
MAVVLATEYTFPVVQYMVACGSTRVGTGADSDFVGAGDVDGTGAGCEASPLSWRPESEDSSLGCDDSLGEGDSVCSVVDDPDEDGPEPRLDPAACAAEAGERTPVIDSSKASTIVAHTSARIRDATPVFCRGFAENMDLENAILILK